MPETTLTDEERAEILPRIEDVKAHSYGTRGSLLIEYHNGELHTLSLRYNVKARAEEPKSG